MQFVSAYQRMPAERAKERNNQITSRLSVELRARLDAINRAKGTSDARIVQELLEAFCTEVEAQNDVRFPLIVLLAEKQHLLVAEHGPGKGSATPPGKPPDNPKRHRGDGPRRAVS